MGTHFPLTFPRTDPPGQIHLGPPLSSPPTLSQRIEGAQARRAGRGGAAHPAPGSRSAPTHAPAWSGPCRPRVAAAGHARAPGGGGGRGAALPTWTSSSGGSRGPAAGGGAGCGGCGGAGCACGWWCGCFSSSPAKSAASRAGFAAPSTGLSCANTGSSCGAGGWGTGPRRALMVSTRVAIGTQGATPGAGRGSGALPNSPTLTRAGELGAGPRAEKGRLRADPLSQQQARFSKARTKSKTLPLRHASTPTSSRRPLSPAPPHRALSLARAHSRHRRSPRASSERAYLPRDY